jgi:hypothetical protein
MDRTDLRERHASSDGVQKVFGLVLPELARRVHTSVQMRPLRRPF